MVKVLQIYKKNNENIRVSIMTDDKAAVKDDIIIRNFCLVRIFYLLKTLESYFLLTIKVIRRSTSKPTI